MDETPQGDQGQEVPQDTPPVESPSADGGDHVTPSEPTDAERLAAEREERLRLEGQVRALESVAARPPAPAQAPAEPPQRITADLIESEYAAGRITEAQRIAHLAKLVQDEGLRERDLREREATAIRSASEKLAEYVREYPDLNDRTSDLIRKVNEELEANPRFNRNDPRDQLTAVRLVVGGHRLGGPPVSDREFNRRRAPAGGAGSAGAAPGGPASPAPTPLKGIPTEVVSYWRSHGWIPNADAEKKYADRWHAQQARRRVRV